MRRNWYIRGENKINGLFYSAYVDTVSLLQCTVLHITRTKEFNSDYKFLFRSSIGTFQESFCISFAFAQMFFYLQTFLLFVILQGLNCLLFPDTCILFHHHGVYFCRLTISIFQTFFKGMFS
jgi:hypothetical protein